MNSKLIVSIAALALACACVASGQQKLAAGAKKPNIVVFWGDDIGQSNVSASLSFPFTPNQPHTSPNSRNTNPAGAWDRSRC